MGWDGPDAYDIRTEKGEVDLEPRSQDAVVDVLFYHVSFEQDATVVVKPEGFTYALEMLVACWYRTNHGMYNSGGM